MRTQDMDRAKKMETWLLGCGHNQLHTISQSRGNRCQHVSQNWKLASASCSRTQNVQAWGQKLLTSVTGVSETSFVGEDTLTWPSSAPDTPGILWRQPLPEPALLQGVLLLLWGLPVPCVPQGADLSPSGLLESRVGHRQPEEGFCPLHT